MLTEQLTGLPQAVIDAFQNCVVTTKKSQGFKLVNKTITKKKIVNGIYIPISTETTKVVQPLAQKTESFAAYALNLIHNYVHEFGYTYFGEVFEGVHEFRRPDATVQCRTENGVFTMNFTHENVVWRTMEPIPGTRQYQPREYSEAEIMAFKTVSGQPVTEEQLEAWDSWSLVGEVRNPETHICNIFAEISKGEEWAGGGHAYYNGTLINGKPWKEGRNLISMLGQKMNALMWKWVLYNDCAIGSSASLSSGNFGQCNIGFYAENSDQADMVVLYSQPNGNIGAWEYDPDRAHAVLQLELCETPMPEKNGRDEGYLDLKTGERIQRLPRG